MLFLLLAQVTPVQPIVKGTGLPPAVVTEEKGVLAPIEALFAGLAARDPQAVLAPLRPDATATVAEERPDGIRTIRHMTRAQFADFVKPGPERYAETISDPAIEIDGDIAMVWAPYVFTVNGRPLHCGYDHFDLVRENGAWKIQNVTWSSRVTGCEAR